MGSIFIAEDSKTLQDVLVSLLEANGHTATAAESEEESFLAIRDGKFDCVIADLRLKEGNALRLMQRIRELENTVPFIITSAFGTIELAVSALKQGASDFIEKPFEIDALLARVSELAGNKKHVFKNHHASDNILFTSSVMSQLLEDAKKVARVDSSILLTGESGVGKEVLARFIHHQSPRRNGPFVAVNCGAIPDELVESELFGHEQGAFTGAQETRIGVFEFATEGTIFLDEIGEMPPSLQVKLLRALQEGEIKRLGATKVIKVNPRIICATNQDLHKGIARGTFREDLYYRIAVVDLHIPSLRSRPEDISLLTQKFLGRFKEEFQRPSLTLTRQAEEVLLRHSWKGNVRELENVIHRAVLLADGQIQATDLGIGLPIDWDALTEAKNSLSAIAGRAAQEAERELILQALTKTTWNKLKAAHLLGVSYKTLLAKIREYELSKSSLIGA